jgi:DNA-binding transcriptional LysR family regulator
MGTVDLNDLGVFAAVVETASFSKAALRLDVPKSSVSRAIVRLEESLRARLLHRTTRRVTPSSAGRALYEKVRAEITSLRHAVGERPELDHEPSGRLRVSAALSFDSFLANVIADFVERHRAVDVELHLSDEHVDLVAEGVDLALRFANKPLKSKTLTVKKLGRATAALYAAPSYLERRGLPRSPADLERHEWVVFSRNPTFPLENGGERAHVVSRGRIACDTMSFVHEAARNGCGLAYLPIDVAAPYVAAGRLVRVLPRWTSPSSTLWAVWPGGRKPDRKVSAFVAVVLAKLRL